MSVASGRARKPPRLCESRYHAPDMPTLVMISKKPQAGLGPGETWVRRVFVLGYVALTILMFSGLEFELAGTVFTVPRLFWTVGLPLLPIGIGHTSKLILSAL